MNGSDSSDWESPTSHDLIVEGATLHNLQDVDVRLPRGRLIVVTGPSGSGKSSLVFDTIHHEGQRQYLESLGIVTEGYRRASVRRIQGLSPSISVGQHLVNRSPRSTVGTATEVFTYLRLLFARIGTRRCGNCGGDVPPPLTNAAAVEVFDEDSQASGPSTRCPICGSPVPDLTMGHLSFNKPIGACPTCTGIGEIVAPDLAKLIDPSRSVVNGGVLVWDRHDIARYTMALPRAAALFGLGFDIRIPIGDLDTLAQELLLNGSDSKLLRQRFPNAPRPPAVADGRLVGVVPALMGRYERSADKPQLRARLARLLQITDCTDCGGSRLNPSARAVQIDGRSLVELGRLQLTELSDWIEKLPSALDPGRAAVAETVVADLRTRIERLVAVGVGYLSLDRSSPSLSGGEAQRLRLASLLGSGLTGVLYVLDEPTVGLHPSDVRRLIAVLRRLRDMGNTVLVVEHDLDVTGAADIVVDLGPGAGPEGGRVVAFGPPSAITRHPTSLTGAHLSGLAPRSHTRRRAGNGFRLTIRGARTNNLQDITVDLPLGALTAVTGVSGSGKSSLIFDTLERAAHRHFSQSGPTPGLHDSIEGWEHIDSVVKVDQSHIGRSPRSNPATYTGIFDDIRAAFAGTDDARRQGLTPAHFSFNVPGGRCERCSGAGVVVVPMHFLPDIEVPCPACRGRRYTEPVLGVTMADKTIADVLELAVEDALEYFSFLPSVADRLQLLSDVGVGYLLLGQPATTLSGGEAQRIKLARELSRRTRRALYLLDEPTTGLHPADIARLLDVLQRLIDRGNTVIVVEHDLDVISASDWVIDLGPGGGFEGGELVAVGTPDAVAAAGTVTGTHLWQRLGQDLQVS
ncbi:MAG TPA: excinuclease ABC subunit UvrA [Acidimicrobiia bacterium]|nr:excinuclease ABC subunit UvrA [Acidimicrobiia bacterium]